MGTVAASIAFAAAGCGSSDDDEPATTSAAQTTVTEATTPATTTPSDKPPKPATLPVGDGDGGIALEQIGEFEQPLYVTQPEGDPNHLYVVEQCGQIERVPLDGSEPEVFLDVAELIVCGGEQGLLSLAFAPDYAESGLLYVYYTDTAGTTKMVEYEAGDDGATADPESARELVSIDDFAANHNGGLLVFGPDGELYAGTGDGGGGGDPERNGQDRSSLLGKLLRVDTESGETEIAALGLRNPWRYSFDRKSGDLWIGDVGQDELEEIDSAPADELDQEPNFGWSAFEGTQPYNDDQEAPGALGPTLEYGRDLGCSVTGGYVVRDPELRSLYGRYLYGDYCLGELRSFTAEAGSPAADDRTLGLEVSSLSSFGEDADGHVYATSLEGPVFRLVAAGD